MMYTYDHDERLPSARTWRAEIAKYVGDESVFLCPFDREGPSYAFNAALSGMRMEVVLEPSRTVLLFESNGRDFGTVTDVQGQGRHYGVNMASCTGQVRRVAPGKESELIWTLAPLKSERGSVASPGRE